MIERAGEVLLGRNEPTTHENQQVRAWVASALPRAKWLLSYRWSDKAELVEGFSGWNVVRMHGPYLNWREVGFEVWDGLGREPLPVLSRSYLFRRYEDRCDPIEFAPARRRVLLHPELLLGQPDARYRRLHEQLDRKGLTVDPRSVFYDGLMSVISEAGFEVVGWDLLKSTGRATKPSGIPHIKL